MTERAPVVVIVGGGFAGLSAAKALANAPVQGILLDRTNQQGRYAGAAIHHSVTGQPAPGPFRYFDKGTMAVVGQAYAVLESGRVRLKGSLAWMAWAAVHILSLAQPGLRISVFLQWMWTYLTRQRGSRLIVDHHPSMLAARSLEENASPRNAEAILGGAKS